MTERPIADYVEERRAVDALWDPDCRKRILFFRGESGCGKTTLIQTALARMPDTVRRVPVQLRGSSVNVAQIFYQAGAYLGWERLPRLVECVNALQGASHAPEPIVPPLYALHQFLIRHFSDREMRMLCFAMRIVEYDALPGSGQEEQTMELIGYLERRNQLATLIETGVQLRPELAWAEIGVGLSKPSAGAPLWGYRDRLANALRAPDPSDAARRRATLTEAWFEDLTLFDSPLLMLFDTYEQASSEVKQWMDATFLAHVARARPLRVLLAGQQVPDTNNIEWGPCAMVRDLLGVPEAVHWWPVVKALNKVIDVPNPQSWLAGVCHALRGNPRAIMQIIEKLPDKEV